MNSLFTRKKAWRVAKPLPSLESIDNQVRLSRYKRKKAIKQLNNDVRFPLEIYR